MIDDATLPDLIAALDALEEQLEQLNENKQALREQIADTMAEAGLDNYQTSIGDRPVRVRVKRTTRVDYDETVLRDRLGDRYALLLEPDVARIRKHLDVVEPLLDPVLDVVGVPARERVEQLVRDGTLAASDFAGAFTKETRTTLYVRRKKVRGPAPRDDESAPY
jgi:hypothetical protein